MNKKKFEKINKLLRKDRQKRRITLLFIMAFSILAGVLSIYTFISGLYFLVTNQLGIVDFVKNYLSVDSVVLCEQLFVINKSDITDSDKAICYLSISDRLAIIRKLKVSLGLTDLTSVNVVTEFQNKSFIDNEHVVIQNDYCNAYSPTAIVGCLFNDDVKSICTENKQKNMINKCFVNFKGIGTKLRKYLMIREDFQHITC